MRICMCSLPYTSNRNDSLNTVTPAMAGGGPLWQAGSNSHEYVYVYMYSIHGKKANREVSRSLQYHASLYMQCTQWWFNIDLSAHSCHGLEKAWNPFLGITPMSNSKSWQSAWVHTHILNWQVAKCHTNDLVCSCKEKSLEYYISISLTITTSLFYTIKAGEPYEAIFFP